MTTQISRALIVWLVLAAVVSIASADSFMGQYAGTYYPDSKVQMPATAVVVATTDTSWRIVITAPKPGAGRDGAQIELYGNQVGSHVHISYPSGGYRWDGGINGNHLSVRSAYGQHFELDKVVKTSPKELLAPPADAVVLLPHKEGVEADLSAWTNQQWKALDDGVMQVNKGTTRTKERFGDIKHLHLEFKLPLEPRNRGQNRGNSGVFFNDIYEVQILDSFGLVETSGDCGSLYSLKRPDVNASLPPETWQTYDIEFRSARLNADGSVEENARITVLLNGVKIHDNVEIPHGTANRNAEIKTTGPIQLQDHSHPIQFRNIWLVKG